MPLITPPKGDTGPTFNGGTITTALDVAPSAGASVAFAVEAPAAQATSVVRILDKNGVDAFDIGQDAAAVGIGIAGDIVLTDTNGFTHIHSGNTGVVEIAAQATDTLGFYGHAATALQTGVPITAAGIHAALVALGLITA